HFGHESPAVSCVPARGWPRPASWSGARHFIEDLLARADNPKALKAWMRRQELWAEQEVELDAEAALDAFERMVMAELRPRKRRSR
ncbi:hypothetical protein, partial [Thiomonas sp.]